MNIFYTDTSPWVSARTLCDKHIVKMPVETVQMLVSALNRHDIQHQVLTKAGALHKGGYRYHPCTVWAGDSRSNASWLFRHGCGLCHEYFRRYGHIHIAYKQLGQFYSELYRLPDNGCTEPFQAMPGVLKVAGDPISAYRQYMQYKVNSKPSVFTWRQAPHRKPTWIT